MGNYGIPSCSKEWISSKWRWLLVSPDWRLQDEPRGRHRLGGGHRDWEHRGLRSVLQQPSGRVEHSHWSRSAEILCSDFFLTFIPFVVMISGRERIYYRGPNAIKTERKARNPNLPSDSVTPAVPHSVCRTVLACSTAARQRLARRWRRSNNKNIENIDNIDIIILLLCPPAALYPLWYNCWGEFRHWGLLQIRNLRGLS